MVVCSNVLPIAFIDEPSGNAATREREHSENEFRLLVALRNNKTVGSLVFGIAKLKGKTRTTTVNNNTTLVWARQTPRMPPA